MRMEDGDIRVKGCVKFCRKNYWRIGQNKWLFYFRCIYLSVERLRQAVDMGSSAACADCLNGLFKRDGWYIFILYARYLVFGLPVHEDSFPYMSTKESTE